MPDQETTDAVADQDGERLDVFVARRVDGLTRSRARKLIDEGLVLVEGRAARASHRLEPGQRVSVTVPPAREPSARPEAIALDIIHEDADIIVINKPAGMTVHPAPGHERSTLVNAILAHCAGAGEGVALSGVGGVLRPGIVHRLDRDTSGVIVVVKNDEAHNALARQLRERSVEKTYLALIEGTPKPAEGVIDAPIARDPKNRQRMAIVEGGRASQTAYKVLERYGSQAPPPAPGYSLVEVRPKTGRTHQIRVHLAAIGHPIAGDRLYGKPSKLVPRQFLHAARIAFTHPRTGERVEYAAELPADLGSLLAMLRG
jgi:23S rRNA pseudouridine1911/1915/1917 synthase